MGNLKELSQEERLHRLRHSAAHIMAEAVLEMFPDAKIGIGPPIHPGLHLLSFHEEYGPGLVYWHPKGGRVRTIIEVFWREEHYRAGYELVYSPHIGRSTLWETSGHLDFYAESMYSPMDIDGQNYYVKPMNCPFHIQMYRTTLQRNRAL